MLSKSVVCLSKARLVCEKRCLSAKSSYIRRTGHKPLPGGHLTHTAKPRLMWQAAPVMRLRPADSKVIFWLNLLSYVKNVTGIVSQYRIDAEQHTQIGTAGLHQGNTGLIGNCGRGRIDIGD